MTGVRFGHLSDEWNADLPVKDSQPVNYKFSLREYISHKIRQVYFFSLQTYTF